MDTFTQGILGASLAQAFSSKEDAGKATLIGLVAGMLPDADLVIRSAQDPLLGLLIHRHFSHSLAFIPVGSLIAALMVWPFVKNSIRFSRVYFFAILAYATAGFLDACTTYGTYLFWPFSDQRVAWDNIAIIDPLFTLPLGLMVFLTFRRKKAMFARIGFAFAIAYLMLGFAARDVAKSALLDVVNTRNHTAVSRVKVMPTLGNLFLWRGIYESDGKYFVDAVRISFFNDPVVYPGSSVPKFDVEKQLPELKSDTVLHRDIQRFSHFADDYLARHPSDPEILGDMRYSKLPNRLDPLWGIRVNPDAPDRHVDMIYFRSASPPDFKTFFQMLLGKEVR